jgi:hypothetical protein
MAEFKKDFYLLRRRRGLRDAKHDRSAPADRPSSRRAEARGQSPGDPTILLRRRGDPSEVLRAPRTPARSSPARGLHGPGGPSREPLAKPNFVDGPSTPGGTGEPTDSPARRPASRKGEGRRPRTGRPWRGRDNRNGTRHRFPRIGICPALPRARCIINVLPERPAAKP